MIPRKLALRNFMCYREDLPPLEFEGIGIACLSGDNGAGKSALLDAITWALWGQARLKSDDELIALGAQEMEVELIFTLDGLDYRVIRKRNKSKRGQSWLDFQVRNNDGWKALSAATLRETQQVIVATLRMDYDIFANSAYLRQGHADEFTRKEPGRRKQVLADILGLETYEDLESAAKERARDLDGHLKILEGQIGELQRRSEKRPIYATMVAAAKERAHDLAAIVAAAETTLARTAERLHTLEARRTLRDDLRKRLAPLRTETDDLTRDIVNLRTAIDTAQNILDKRADIDTGIAALRTAQRTLEHLDGLRSTYDTLLERRRTTEKNIEDAERHLRTDLRIAEGEQKGLAERAARRPTIATTIENLTTRLATLATLDDELAAARNQRSELRERDQAVHRLELQREKLQKHIDLRHDSLVATREELKRRIKDATTKLKDQPRWQAELETTRAQRHQRETDLAHLETLRREEHETVEQLGALRAACATIKSQGEDINKKLALLTDNAQTCPLCGNELGHDGIAHIEAEYDRERKTLRAQFSTTKRDADHLEHHLATQRHTIAQLEERTAELPHLAARIARLESDLAAAEDLRQHQNDDQRALDDIQIQLIKGDYERGTRADIARVEAEIAALGNSATLDREVRALETRITQLETRIAEQAHLKAQLVNLQRDLRAIDDETPALHETEERIAELRTTLAMDDFAHEERITLTRIDSDITALGYTPELHRTARETIRDLTHWADEERRLQHAEAQIERDTHALLRAQDQLQRRSADLESITAHLSAIDDELRALTPLLRERDEITAALQKSRRELDVAQRDLGEKQNELKNAEDAAVELAACTARRETLGHRKTLFDELHQAFGKKGLQAMLIETAIPEIEREANTLLARMTDNQMHLTFETQRDTKKGDISETLEIKIADALGTRDYDAYSGGESFRLNFAIRIALAKLLAKRAGARLETLVIDEGFGTLDTRGRERLIEAITSVQGEFKQILVVTHIQELKDMFPIQIEITKTPRGSIWALG